jgi:predicted acylesterase/phospholipase RssA
VILTGSNVTDIAVEQVISSSAIPAVFPTQNWMNTTFIDGGFTLTAGPFTPYLRCKEDGFEDHEITMDFFYLHTHAPIGKADTKSAFNAYFRA